MVSTNSLRILVADDERAIADTMGVILRLAGFEVKVCYDGSEAVAEASTFRPDIVLADYSMPQMNGIDACVRIKAMLPGCRIVMLSGHSLSHEMEKRQPGRHDFLLLSKPMLPDDLLTVLASGEGAPTSSDHMTRVLNVDDVEAHRYSITRLFARAGFEVTEAGTGCDALRLALESKPDVILLDIHLPDKDGFDVCAELKSNPETARITILHVTSSATDSDSAIRSKEVGADDYIAYPIAPSNLVRRVREVLQLRYLQPPS